MHNDNTIEIKSSRIKLAGLFVGAIAFVAIGIWFLLEPQRALNPLFHDVFIVRIIGIASITFFGLCGLFILKKMGDKKAAVIISNNGITDNSNAASLGFIPWADVVAIRETAVINQKFITIDVNDPERYINSQSNLIKRKLMQVNYKQYGSLISISANALQCSHQQLKAFLEDAFKSYRAGYKSAL
jgi:hypothetical protein